jgi:hypothetical protein
MLKKVEFQASSFDRLRMRPSSINSPNLMMSLSTVMRFIGRGEAMIVAPECAAAHIRGLYGPKRLLRSRIRRERRSGMTGLQPVPVLRTPL